MLADILLSQGRTIRALISPDKVGNRAILQGITHLPKDNDIERFSPDEIELVNGLGMQPASMQRQKVQQYFEKLGYHFASVISEKAIVSQFAELDEACQVLPGAIIQAGVTIGAHSIINSGALVEHDCQIGTHNHIAPNAVLCGQVETGNGVFVGANATVLPSVRLSQSAIVGAGAVVNQDLQADQIAYPAKPYIVSR